MAFTTFAGIPEKLPIPLHSVVSGNISSSVSGSLYLQARNRQGFNLYSDPIDVNLSVGEGLEVTIPEKTSNYWDIHEYILSFSPTNSINSAYVIASYPYFDSTGNIPAENDFPITIMLDSDRHWQTQLFITSSSELPDNPLHGARIHNDEWGEYRYWDDFFLEWRKCYPQSFSTYIDSTEGINGFARDLQDEGFDYSSVISSEYNLSGLPGESIQYWLRNDRSTSISKGQEITIQFYWGNKDISWLMAGGWEVEFLGFVNIATGQSDLLDTDGYVMAGIGTTFSYDPGSNFNLKKPLPPGYAYVMEITPNISLADINNSLPSNAEIRVLVRFGSKVDEVTDIARMEEISIRNAIALGGD